MRRRTISITLALTTLAVLVLLLTMGVFIFRDIKENQKPVNVAQAAYQNKDYDKAAEAVKKEIVANPSSFEHYNFLANILRDKQDSDGAIINYQKALEINPDFLQPYINLASLYWNIGKIDEAKSIIDKGLEKFPEDEQLKKLKNDIK